MDSDIPDLLEALAHANVQITVRDGKLLLRGPDPGEQLRERARRHREALLAWLARQDEAATAATFPVSFAQEAHCALQQMAPESPAYHLLFASRIASGAGDRLRNAVAALPARHGLLRARYRSSAEGVEGVRVPSATITVTELSLGAVEESEVRAALNRWAERPFDLQVEPPLRAALVDAAPGGSYFAVVAHHLAVDFRALEVILRELEDAAAVRPGSAAAASSDDFPAFLAFARQQRQWMQSASGVQQLADWQAELAGAPLVFELPSVKPRPSRQDFTGQILSRPLGADLSSAIRQTARAFGVTPFVLVLGVFARLLMRYSGQSEVLVGVPVSLRDRERTVDAVGDFVNTLPLRIRADGDTVGTFLSGVRDHMFWAMERSRVPFAAIAQSLQVGRDLSRMPLCQVFFVWHQARRASEQVGASSSVFLDTIASYQCGAPVDLMLVADDRGGDITLRFHHAPAVVAPELAARVAANLEAMLRRVASRGDAPLGKIDVLAPEEAAFLTRVGQGRQTPPSPQTCWERIAQMSRERASRPAIRCNGSTTTYGDLDRRSSAAAAALACAVPTSSAGPVAIWLNRGPDMLVAALAAQRAGRHYVPLDPSQPPERLRSILEDAAPCAVIADRSIPFVGTPFDAPWLTMADLSTLAEAGAAIPTTPPALAYTIYTSGTSGRPKGVAVPQEALANLIDALAQEPGLAANDVVLAVAPFGFDLSVHELFVPLALGATVVIADDATRHDGARLVELIADEAVTFVVAAPSTWKLLLSAGWKGRAGLRAAAGAEPLSPDLAREVIARTGTLWNIYGPTEATVWAATGVIDLQGLPPGGGVPVGHPLANLSLRVTAPNLQRAPLGAIGEVCIGGRGLASGYVNQPDLTAQAFVADPEASDARLYRTGDFGRVLDDGSLLVLGRRDNQIKLRGYRIECAEVEAALRRLSEIGDAVVCKQAFAAGDEHLVAHVTWRAEALPWAVVRERLREHLPSYMIPTRIRAHDALPLTPNGKVNRAALTLTEERPEDGALHIEPPASPLERVVLRCWQRVFEREQIGVCDDFIAAGGTSLHALRLAHVLGTETGSPVSATHVFNHPTVRSLAAAIEHGIEDPSVPTAEVLRRDAQVALTLPVVHQRSRPGCVLLTGATGFLGVHILGSLVGAGAEVLCAVRATSADAGRRRLVDRCAELRVPLARPDAVSALPADLEAERLGMTPADYADVVERADAIIHCGATVNFALPYARVRAANVDSARALLRLATERRIRPLHFVSTYSVVDARAAAVPEAFGIPHHDLLNTGYVQSKWAAELMMMAAAQQGVPVVVYRPSRIVGCPRSGAVNVADLFCHLLRAVIQLSMAPDDAGFDNFVAVDYCADVVARRTLAGGNASEVVHLLAPEWQRWSTIGANLRELGVPVATRPFATWLDALDTAGASGTVTPVPTIVDFLRGPGGRLREIVATRHPQLPRDHAARVGAVEVEDAVSVAALRNYIDFLTGCGFLESAGGRAEAVLGA